MMQDSTIRPIVAEEASLVSAFVLSVFDEFVGCDYSEEGNRTFREYVAPEAVRKRIEAGGVVLGAYTEGQLVGAVEMRRPNHISLLFVDKAYHRRGISRALLNHVIAALPSEDSPISSLTVNASPYSMPIYERLGFQATADLQEKDGIKFVPMAMRLS